jgi:hypothetical protein
LDEKQLAIADAEGPSVHGHMQCAPCVIDARHPFSLMASEMPRRHRLAATWLPSYALRKYPNEVFRLSAARDIARHEIISETPVQVVPEREMRAVRRIGLEELCFVWTLEPRQYAVALGAAAFLGDSRNPNCRWKGDPGRRVVAIRARRPISAGEALTLDFETGLRRRFSGASSPPHLRRPVEETLEPEVPKAAIVRDRLFGRTVVALQDIARGEKISEVPARVIPAADSAAFFKIAALGKLAHAWGSTVAMALGIPALVNHSCRANSYYAASFKRRTISLVAHRAIPAGLEITMNYLGFPDGSLDDNRELMESQGYQPLERKKPLRLILNGSTTS